MPPASRAAPPFIYEGTELEALTAAHNYYAWLSALSAPHLGTRAVEIGAGVGTAAAALLRAVPGLQLTLVEPAANNVPALEARFGGDARVKVLSGFFADTEAQVRHMDAVILFNVLEHVGDPLDLLRSTRQTLRPGGRLVLLVPALPALFGTLDTAFGHLCRYDAGTIARLVAEAGYLPVTMRYVNSLGVIPWFLLGRVLRRRTLSSAAVRLYDALAIPLLSRVERRMPPPFGQSLFVVAQLPGA